MALHPIAQKHGYKSNEAFYKDYPTEESYTMKHGGVFYDGTGYKKGNANTGMQYKQGGVYQGQYNMWENGGQVNGLAGVHPSEYALYRDGGIHIKPQNRGKFTEYKKRTGKTTEEALHSPDSHVRQMANFSRNAAKWHHQDGGPVQYQDGGNTVGTGDSNIDNRYLPNSAPTYMQDSSQGMPYSDPNVQPTGLQGHPISQKRSPYFNFGDALTDTIGTVGALGSFIQDQNNAKSVHDSTQRMGLSDNMSHMNQPGVKGDYTPNTGIFRPQNSVPTKAGTFYPAMKNGGQYVKGATYDLDHSTIQNMIKQGYEIEYL